MCDHGNTYVKKKDFYRAMVVVLFFILIAISHFNDDGGNKKDGIEDNIVTFMVLGYILYFLFLTVKLRYQKEYKKVLNDKNFKN